MTNKTLGYWLCHVLQFGIEQNNEFNSIKFLDGDPSLFHSVQSYLHPKSKCLFSHPRSYCRRAGEFRRWNLQDRLLANSELLWS